jgi:hypothetical protein
MIAVIVIPTRNTGEDERVIGPFPNGDIASRWGFMHLQGKCEWYWLPLEAPK